MRISADGVGEADCVLLGGRAITLQPDASGEAQGVAVKGDRILRLIRRDQLAEVRGPGTTVVDLGDRAFEVIHTPGHSPGGIALWERKTGILLSGDIVYDGPLIDDAWHSVPEDYAATLEAMRGLPVSVVHGGHFPSFGPTRYRQLIDQYLASKRGAGCHLRGRSS